MRIAAKLAAEHGLKHRGTDYPLEGAVNAINEALELAAKRIEAKIGSLAVSRDRARADGREGVAACRQSDIETCERMAAEVRSMKSSAGPVQPTAKQD